MSIARVQLPTVLFLLFALVTCAEHPAGEAKASNDAATAAPSKEPAAESDSPSAGQSCADVACQSSNECCKGYACGFDPERSRVQRYCLGP